MTPGPLTVLKFGSSVLRSPEDLPAAVGEITRRRAGGEAVLAVASAFAGTTDRLMKSARRAAPSPDPAPLAALMATGETVSASLLAMAVAAAGVEARLVDPRDAGLAADGPPLDSQPVGLDALRIRDDLRSAGVVVVPGFYGRGERGVHLLGRGGSDLTALFLADRLGASACLLLKDVDGVYASDPALPGIRPARFETLTWADALKLGARVVQTKALEYAASRRLRFEVGAGPGRTTLVGADATRLNKRPRLSPGP